MLTFLVYTYACAWPDSQFHPEMGKLIYCSRTVGEIEKALEELKRLIKYREKELGTPADFTAVGLTSRRNLCLHERVRAPAFPRASGSWCCRLANTDRIARSLCVWEVCR